MKSNLLATLVISLCLSAYSSCSIACSCAKFGRGNIEKPDYIFIGHPENMKLSLKFWENEETNKFKVTKDYKGNLSEHVTVKTRTDSAACGISYVANVNYLIFGYEKNGIIRSGVCGSFNAESYEGKRLIKLLGEIHNEQ